MTPLPVLDMAFCVQRWSISSSHCLGIGHDNWGRGKKEIDYDVCCQRQYIYKLLTVVQQFMPAVTIHAAMLFAGHWLFRGRSLVFKVTD